MSNAELKPYTVKARNTLNEVHIMQVFEPSERDAIDAVLKLRSDGEFGDVIRMFLWSRHGVLLRSWHGK